MHIDWNMFLMPFVRITDTRSVIKLYTWPTLTNPAIFYYCEITLNQVDKWHGLSHLMDHLELEAEHICAVGDELNDMAMVEAATHGVAMDNGHEELKAIANFICGHNEDDGLLLVVDYIRQHNQSADEWPVDLWLWVADL